MLLHPPPGIAGHDGAGGQDEQDEHDDATGLAPVPHRRRLVAEHAGHDVVERIAAERQYKEQRDEPAAPRGTPVRRRSRSLPGRSRTSNRPSSRPLPSLRSFASLRPFPQRLSFSRHPVGCRRPARPSPPPAWPLPACRSARRGLQARRGRPGGGEKVFLLQVEPPGAKPQIQKSPSVVAAAHKAASAPARRRLTCSPGAVT